MTSHTPITILSESESWRLMASQALGRVVTSADNQPEIFPVNFVVADRAILFRTAEGTKLVSAAINNNVVFEVDGYNDTEGWSVIVRGTARSLRTEAEIEAAQRAPLRSWTATPKEHYVRIVASRITGRRFRFGSGPDSGPN